MAVSVTTSNVLQPSGGVWGSPPLRSPLRSRINKAFKEARSGKQKQGVVFTKCARCGTHVSKKLRCVSHDGQLLCRLCYRQTNCGDMIVDKIHRLNNTHIKSAPVVYRARTCLRCGTLKPLDSSNFYRKIRGSGFMNVCRVCRDMQLRKSNRRICWGCWKAYNAGCFSASQWLQPEQEPAYCMRCANHKGVQRRRAQAQQLKPGEKICPRCLRPLPVADFYVVGGRASSYCRSCMREYNRKQYKNRKGKVDEPSLTHAPRTIRMIFNMQRRDEQDLVNAWANGEAIPVDTTPIPDETKRASSKVVRRFARDFDLMLGLTSGDCKEVAREDTRKTTAPKFRIGKSSITHVVTAPKAVASDKGDNRSAPANDNAGEGRPNPGSVVGPSSYREKRQSRLSVLLKKR